MNAMASQITSISIVCPRFIQVQIKENIKKPCVTGLFEGNPPVTSGFPSQRTSNTENVSIWWHHHRGSTPFYFMYDHKQSMTFHWCTINAPTAFAWCTNHFIHKMEFWYIGWNRVQPLWSWDSSERKDFLCHDRTSTDWYTFLAWWL